MDGGVPSAPRMCFLGRFEARLPQGGGLLSLKLSSRLYLCGDSRSMAEGSLVGQHQLAADSRTSVGIMYIVYAQNTTSNQQKAKNLRRYLKEAAASARRTKASNPRLPVVLATNTAHAWRHP